MSRIRSLVAVLAVAAALLATAAAAASAGGGPTPIVVHVDRQGFAWADAAIGALAGGGLALAAFGSVALLRLRRAGSSTVTRGESS